MSDPTNPGADVDAPEPWPEPVAVPRSSTRAELRGPRPAPSVSSLAGTAGGLFIALGLFAFLGELGSNKRLAAIGLSLAFEVLGVVLLQFSKGRRSATAGGTLAAISLVPLLGYTFVSSPRHAATPGNHITTSVTVALVVAAAVWFCAWFFGPGRRYAFFLAAACIALWMACQVQLVSSPYDQLMSRFGGESSSTTFTRVGTPIPNGSSGYTYSNGTSIDGSASVGSSTTFRSNGMDPFKPVSDPTVKLGVTSLLFGVVYLGLARRRDKVGDERAGTALYAVAAPILVIGVGYLASHVGSIPTSGFALVLGAAGIWCGTRAGRRFTSWAGLLAAIVGVVNLVDRAFGRSARGSGAAFVVIGLLLAVGVAVVERRGGITGLRRRPSPDAPDASTAETVQGQGAP